MKLTDFSELYYGVSNVIYFQSIFLQDLQKKVCDAMATAMIITTSLVLASLLLSLLLLLQLFPLFCVSQLFIWSFLFSGKVNKAIVGISMSIFKPDSSQCLFSF